MRLIYENDTALYNTKKTQTRTKRDKFKNTITLFLEIYFESQNKH